MEGHTRTMRHRTGPTWHQRQTKENASEKTQESSEIEGQMVL